jgi:hypothetical protein
MSGPASLSGALPDGDGNGLSAIVHELIAHPRQIRVVVALVDTMKITTKIDEGSKVATVRVRRIEAITDPGDRAQLERLLLREFERRTGQTVLPFDLESDVRAAFAADDQDEEGPQ